MARAIGKRRLNYIRWVSDDGKLFASYEIWSLVPSAGISRKVILGAQDKISGVGADGYLWIKQLDVHPPGDGWTEAA